MKTYKIQRLIVPPTAITILTGKQPEFKIANVLAESRKAAEAMADQPGFWDSCISDQCRSPVACDGFGYCRERNR